MMRKELVDPDSFWLASYDIARCMSFGWLHRDELQANPDLGVITLSHA